MKIIKSGVETTDSWQHIGDHEEVNGECLIVSLERWLIAPEALTEVKDLGVRIDIWQGLDAILPDLKRFGVIALEFNKSSDERTCAKARLLREQFGFKGEIRAYGNVSSEQLYMTQCGFDAFELPENSDNLPGPQPRHYERAEG